MEVHDYGCIPAENVVESINIMNRRINILRKKHLEKTMLYKRTPFRASSFADVVIRGFINLIATCFKRDRYVVIEDVKFPIRV